MIVSFKHGLGDAVQFGIVTRTIQERFCDDGILIRCLLGKESVFRNITGVSVDAGSCSGELTERFRDIRWREPEDVYPGVPSTKVARCLQEEFGLPFEGVEFRYRIAPSAADAEAVSEYLATVPSKPVAIHYQANTRAAQKNLSHELVKSICGSLVEAGLTPLILDWDDRCPFIDNERIFSPDARHPLWRGLGTGDASIIRYLIEGSVAMLGVDSGPLHVAGATSTPTIGVWRCLHPVQFFDLADNVLHLVPPNHADLIRTPDAGRRAEGLAYFKQAYRSRVYEDINRDVPQALWGAILQRFLDENERGLDELSVGKVYCQYNRSRGFDPFYKGGWQSRYAEMIDRAFGLRGKKVLDVGCAAGALASSFGDRGADVAGIDICRYFIESSPFENIRGRLQTAPAWNLPFPDKSIDLIHCSQVLEHVPEEKQQRVFSELRRVLRPDGFVFAAMPMGEVQTDEWDDVTHSCMHNFEFWKAQAERAGFGHVVSRWEPLHGHPMYREYQWSYLVATGVRDRRPVSNVSEAVVNPGRWIIAHWGDNKRHVFDPVVRALEASGHECRWIRRDDTSARPELLDAMRSGDYDALLTWQRFYPMQRDLLDAVKDSSLSTIFMDYGFHPHYHSVVFDSDGENATSALAAQWSDKERRPPSERAFAKVDELIREHALRAVEVREHPPEGVMQIERPFVFVPLQRPTDSVVRFDSDVHDFGVLVRRVLALAAQRYFVVIKPHPLDRELDFGTSDYTVGRHRVLRNAFHGDNESVNDWLLSQAALVVGVNSNMLFRAALFGTPTIACGRGWYSGSGALTESATDPSFSCLRVRGTDPAKRREYLAACLDRQLTFEELDEPSNIMAVIARIGVLAGRAVEEVTQ